MKRILAVASEGGHWVQLLRLRPAFHGHKVLKRRPHVIITTGAAPGIIALAAGKLLGSRAVWIDSIANAEKLSGSGKLAGKFADAWLTQWPELASNNGPECWGAVL